MRSSMVVALVAGAGITVAALVLRMQSEVRAADGQPVSRLGDMSQRMKDPGYRALKRAEISSKLAEAGVDMANELGLTTAQVHQLNALETNFQMGVLDSLAPSSPGHHPDPAAVEVAVAKQRELRSKLDADIVALLGVEKAQEFRAYVKSQPARLQVKQLQSTLVLEGSPMTVEQQRSLTATIAAGQERRNNAIAAYQVQLRNGAAGDQTLVQIRSAELDIEEHENAKIIQAETPALSPPQLSELQKMLGDDVARSRLHLQAHTSTP